MHILALITTIAMAIFWVSRAARGSRDIVDAAHEIKNLPRKRKFQKAFGKTGYDLVETPIEAATVLMISTARLDNLREISAAEIAAITLELETHMHLDIDIADAIFRQMQNLTQQITLPESALFPMLDILKSNISRDDAFQLAAMMERVASCETSATHEQLDFIRRFKNRMGILN